MRFVLAVLLALCLGVSALPSAVPNARKGTFDPKKQRAAQIQKQWEKDGHSFHYVSNQDSPSGFCLFGKPYEVVFNVSIPTDSAFVRVDQQSGFSGVVCNLDHTDIQFHFTTQADAKTFQQSVSQGHPILTGGQGKAECAADEGMFKRVSLVNDTVLEVKQSAFAAVAGVGSTFAVRVRAFKAAYDHTIQSGTVQFGNAEAGSRFADICERPQDPVHFCVGLNTNEKCTAAAGPIIFYQNEYVTLECSDCWLAFSMDVGLKMSLEDFLLYDSHFKFHDMVVNGALVAQMLAQYQWGVSYDATIPIIGPTNIVQFWLGPIPIIIGFELPLERVADASFDATAQAEAGAIMQWNLGDYEVLWNPVQGWQVDQNEPGLVYKTSVSGEAQFDGSANFGLAPSLTAHLDSFFTTQVEFSAMLHANVQGSTTSKTVCADVNYDVIADGSATLEISIPWIDVDDSWTWSRTWFSKSGTIAQACAGATPRSNTTIILEDQAGKFPRHSKPSIHREDTPKSIAASASHVVAPKLTRQSRGPSGPTKNLKGLQSGCYKNRGYTMSYDVNMSNSYNLLDIPTFPGFHKLDCNAGGTTFRVEFHSDDARKDFMRNAQEFTTFLTGNKALSDRCHGLYDTKVFLFRVLHMTDTSIPFIKYQVEVEVSASQYDEAFQDAHLSFKPDDSVKCGGPGVRQLGESDHVCLGVNTNAACNAAAKPLVMYQGEYITVDCENCYFALQTDVFFELHIQDYWVSTLSGGFMNMSLDASMVLEIIAKVQWNSGTNITQDAVAPTTIVDFAIGPIPVRLWFEIPLRRLAEVQVNIEASVSAGVLAQWNFGDYYVTYTDGKGWSHVVPHPVLTWKPFIGPVQAEFTASAQLGLIPTFAFHVDSVFWTTLTIDPEVHIALNGSLASKEVCASAQAEVTATAYAELDFNVPFIYLHIGAWWGPEKVYDSGVKPLASVCHKFAEMNEVPRLPKPHFAPVKTVLRAHS